jgi:hypothetical protein
METSTIDTILLHPHFEEIKPLFTSNFLFSDNLPVKVIEKTSIQTSTSKGSFSLIVIPQHTENTSSIAIFDYSPMPPKSKVKKPFIKPEGSW